MEISGSRAGGYDYTWELTEVREGKSYNLGLKFEHIDIPSDTNVEVVLVGTIKDSDENAITKTQLTALLNEKTKESKFTTA